MCDLQAVGGPLENKLGGKLHNSGIADGPRNLSEVLCDALISARIPEMRCVRNVKEFKSGLKIVSFAQRKILEDGKIAVDISRTTDDISSGSANHASSG